MGHLFLRRKKKPRRQERKPGYLIPVSVRVTPEQAEYLEKMKEIHRISKSGYLRNLLGKDMEGYQHPSDLLQQFAIPLPPRGYEETVTTEITVKKEKKKVAVRPEQQDSVGTHLSLMAEMKAVLKEKGLAD